MVYATVNDVQTRMTRTLSASEQTMCAALLEDAGVIVDAYNSDASDGAKLIVSCRMVIRAMGDGEDSGVPMGATQGTQTALGYSQSWTMGTGGSVGEMYLGKMEKKLLGVGNRIGSRSPVECLAPKRGECE